MAEIIYFIHPREQKLSHVQDKGPLSYICPRHRLGPLSAVYLYCRQIFGDLPLPPSSLPPAVTCSPTGSRTKWELRAFRKKNTCPRVQISLFGSVKRHGGRREGGRQSLRLPTCLCLVAVPVQVQRLQVRRKPRILAPPRTYSGKRENSSRIIEWILLYSVVYGQR